MLRVILCKCPSDAQIQCETLITNGTLTDLGFFVEAIFSWISLLSSQDALLSPFEAGGQVLGMGSCPFMT